MRQNLSGGRPTGITTGGNGVSEPFHTCFIFAFSWCRIRFIPASHSLYTRFLVAAYPHHIRCIPASQSLHTRLLLVTYSLPIRFLPAPARFPLALHLAHTCLLLASCHVSACE